MHRLHLAVPITGSADNKVHSSRSKKYKLLNSCPVSASNLLPSVSAGRYPVPYMWILYPPYDRYQSRSDSPVHILSAEAIFEK